MQISRRGFAALGLGAVAGLTLSRLARASMQQGLTLEAQPLPADDGDKPFFDWKPVGDRVRVGFGQGGNCLLLAAGSEAMIVDCKNAGLGATLRREAEAFGTPLKLAVNTHHHRDHVGGNPAFTRDLPLFAHKNAVPRIAAQHSTMLDSLGPMVTVLQTAKPPTPRRVIEEAKSLADRAAQITREEFAPTQIVDDQKSISVGGVEVRLRHLGPGHTDNDLFVFIPELNLLQTGDLLFHKLHPFIDLAAGASTIGWQQNVRFMIEMCDEKTVVVPGHGEITDRSGLQKQVEYFDKLREVVRHAKDVEGMKREEVLKLKPGAFEDYGLVQLLGPALGAVFDELSTP